MDLQVRIDCSTLKRDFAGSLMSSAKQKNCSSCGEDFTCGAEGGYGRCWCEDLPHLPLTAIAVRDCVWPQCVSDVIPAEIQAEPVEAATKTDMGQPSLLLEGEDYYSEGGMIVFT